MRGNYVIINGEFILESSAAIHVSDLSIQRGYGIFDFFITVDKQPLYLDFHLDRFFNSARVMHLDKSLNREAIKKLIYQLIEKNDLPASGIRVTLTGGYAVDGYTLSDPNLLITQSDFTFNKENFNKGTRLVSYDHQRQLPEVKTIDYLHAIYLQPYIIQHNADDVLYHHQGDISECPRSNFFIVTTANEIITPAENILKGITRRRILDLKEFDIKELTIHFDQLHDIKEAFITSSTKIVLPVLEIDGRAVADGKPGEITTEIFKRLIKNR